MEPAVVNKAAVVCQKRSKLRGMSGNQLLVGMSLTGQSTASIYREMSGSPI